MLPHGSSFRRRFVAAGNGDDAVGAGKYPNGRAAGKAGAGVASDDDVSEESEGCSSVWNGTGKVFIGCLVLRIASAFVVQTYFNPDEYWQSLEVAHRLVFGYGYMTWEWRAGVRGFLHPLIFAAVYKVLMLTGADSAWSLEVCPRLLQAVFAAVSDLYTYKLASRLFGKSAARWTLFSQLINWFNFFCMVRTFSNCLETSLTIVALYYWPWPRRGAVSEPVEQTVNGDVCSWSFLRGRQLALTVAGLACIVRPTNAVIWLFLGLAELKQGKDRMWFVFCEAVPIGALCFGVMTGIDYWMYGKLVVVPFNFLRFNLLSSGADFYGTHVWHWYFSQGFPAMTGTLLPFALAGMWWSPHPLLVALVVWVLAWYSLLGHKEFRFVLPMLPLAMMFAGLGFSLWFRKRPGSKHGKWPKMLRSCAIAVVVLSNVIAALYLSLVHQRGSMDTIRFLAKGGARGDVDSVFFLTPCHATPFYSHIHRRIPMRMLDCSPSSEEGYVHEERVFFDNPAAFLSQMYAANGSFLHSPGSDRRYTLDVGDVDTIESHCLAREEKGACLPSHLVMFDGLQEQIGDFLDRHHYVQAAHFFHSHVPVNRELQGRLLIYVHIKTES